MSSSSGPAREPMRTPRGNPTRRRWRRLLAAGIVVLALAVLFLLGLFPQEPLRRAAEARLQAALGPSAHIGRLHVVPARLAVELGDLSADNADLSFTVRRVYANLDWATVPGSGIALHSLEIEEPRVVLRAPASAGAAPAPAAATPPPLPPLDVRNVRVTGGAVDVTQGEAAVLALEGIDLRGSLGSGSLAIAATGGHVDQVPIDRIEGEVAVAPDLDLDLRHLDLRSGRSSLRVSGHIEQMMTRPRFELAPTATIALADVSTQIARRGMPGTPLAGKLSLSGRVAGHDLSDLEASLELASDRLDLAGLTVDHLAGRAQHDAASGSNAELRMQILSGRLVARAHADPDGSGGGEMEVASLQLARLPRELGLHRWLSGGTLSGKVGARGTLDRLVVTGRVASRLRARDLPEAALEAQLGGSVAPRARSLDLGWSLDGRTAAPEGPVQAARLVVRGTSRGALPPRTNAALSADLSIATPAGVSEAHLAGQLDLDAQGLRGRVEGQGLGGVLEASARLTPGRVDALEASLEGVDLAQVSHDLAGHLSVRAKAHGPVTRLAHETRMTVADLATAGAPLGSVRAEVNGVGRSTRAQLEAPDLRLRADAELPPRDDVLRASVVLDGTPVAPAGQALGRPLEGEISGQLDARVPLSEPRETVASLRLDTARIASDALGAHLGRPLVARLEDQRLVVEDLRIDGTGLSLTASGSAGLGPAGTLDLRSQVRADLGLWPRPEGSSLAGKLEGDATLSGPLGAPRVEGHVVLEDIVASSGGLPALSIPSGTVELEGDRLTLSIPEGRLADGRVRVEGTVPFAALGQGRRPARDLSEADLRLDWTDMELARWIPAGESGGAREALAGRSSGQAHVWGPLGDLERLRAEIALEPATIETREVSLSLEPTRFGLENGQLTTTGVRLRSRAGTLDLSGSADLVHRTVDAAARGVIELQPLSSFLGEAALAGRAEVDARAVGALTAPSLSGTLRLREASLRARAFGQPLTDLSADLTLLPTRIAIESASGHLGGGTLVLGGGADLEGAAIKALDIRLTARGVSLRYPEGLWSRLDGDLSLTGAPPALLLAGQVRATSGLYNEDLATEKTLLAPLPPPYVSPTLRAVRLDLELVTEQPIRVRNDVARLEATGRLAIRGDMETPQPFGRLEIVTPGGWLFLLGRELEVQRGALIYEGSWEPTIDLGAVTHGVWVESDEGFADRKVDVQVEARGTALELTNAWAARLSGSNASSLDRTLRLWSNAADDVGPDDLASYLATGHPRKNLREDTLRSLGEQAALLLGTRLAGGLRGLGLDEVRVQSPTDDDTARSQGASRDVNLGARLTVGKRLGPHTRLVVSRGLTGAEQSYFELEATPGWGAALSVRRQDDGLFIYGAGQRLTLGGPRSPGSAPDERVRLAAVRFVGSPEISREQLASWTRLAVGKTVSPWAAEEDAERLRRRLAQQGYLAADVTGAMEGNVVTFRVEAGPRYRIEVVGMPQPPDLRPLLEGMMHEEEARERGQRRLLQALHARGYLAAAVELVVRQEPQHEAEARGAERVLSFQVEPGPRFPSTEVGFPGSHSLSQDTLTQIAGGVAALFVSPQEAAERIRRAYYERYYLEARVGPVSAEEAHGRLLLTVPVDEGPRARVALVRFEGASVDASELRAAARLDPGERYRDERLLDALERVRRHYLEQGYRSVRVDPKLVPAGPDLEIVFHIEEGERARIGRVEIHGVTGWLAGRIRSRAGLKEGDAVDPRRLAEIERRLLDLKGVAAARVTASPENPSTVTIDVTRAAWAEVGYDLRYDRDDDLTGLADGELRDVLGLVTIGGRYRYGANVRETRGSLSSTWVRGFEAKAFRLEEDLQLFETSIMRLTEAAGVEQRISLPDRWDLRLGYTFRRVTLTDFEPVNVADVDLALVRDTRNDLLDPTSGRFWNLTLQLSHPRLGSDTSFAKGFAEASFVRPLHGRRLVWAQSLRLGLAHVFDGEPLVGTERFFAGGANSIRGFATKSIGPLDFLDDPAGGQAVFVINQELRYRHHSGVGFALFYDAGNVFETVSALRLSARHSVGFGLRWSSPVGLIRGDLAFPLAPKPGERGWQYVIALGQAF